MASVRKEINQLSVPDDLKGCLREWSATSQVDHFPLFKLITFALSKDYGTVPGHLVANERVTVSYDRDDDGLWLDMWQTPFERCDPRATINRAIAPFSMMIISRLTIAQRFKLLAGIFARPQYYLPNFTNVYVAADLSVHVDLSNLSREILDHQKTAQLLSMMEAWRPYQRDVWDMFLIKSPLIPEYPISVLQDHFPRGMSEIVSFSFTESIASRFQLLPFMKLVAHRKIQIAAALVVLKRTGVLVYRDIQKMDETRQCFGRQDQFKIATLLAVYDVRRDQISEAAGRDVGRWYLYPAEVLQDFPNIPPSVLANYPFGVK